MSCTEETDHYWSYDNPLEWCKHFPYASGSCQSPIDINTVDTIPQMYPPFLFSSTYDSDRLFTISNNGQQIIATLCKNVNDTNQQDVWFSGSSLPGKFHFNNFHLHWGRNDRHGSEHEINGHRFPAEAHFVHKNYDNGQIAVLAFFFSIAESDEHSGWEKYAAVASQLTQVHDNTTCAFSLSQLMPTNDRDFFRYVGSLTTPPCTEGIIWTIFSHAVPIKEDSLNLLRQNVMRTVYRPTQPINGRTIFRNHQYPTVSSHYSIK